MTAALVAATPTNRIVRPVEDNRRIPLDGSTLPQALSSYETGRVDGGQRLERMILVLKPSAMQQQALDTLTAAQQDPRSPLYHRWLTPDQYAAEFGVSPSDIDQVQRWLERYGLQVDEIPAGRRAVVFSGASTQVEAAFQTAMHSYRIAGKDHIANSTDLMIPAALAPVVGGVASLHDFFSAPQHSAIKAAPEYSAGTTHYLAPADFAAIYNVSSLYSQAYTGEGQSIAIAGRSDINLADVRKFRSQFGLSANDPVVILNGRDPGSAVTSDLYESMLDVEWSGAVANHATIQYVGSASTSVTDGVFLSAQYIVNHNLAPVLSVSYGLCETSLGASGNSFFNALWQQAAAQGITVLVAAGDSGAAGCDPANAARATQGRAVNGICSTPYSVCVGGTGFSEGANSSRYWADSNTGGGGSALGYIPEAAWNESGPNGLWSTGGGVSNTYAKPAWQTGPGVPVDGRRDVPDVALTAAGHDAYMVQVSGALYAFSGTSASAPAFAGLLSLVAQKQAGRLGNANPALYKLATAQRTAGGPAVFHDIVAGTNAVPGVAGFSAGGGYDQATGLGSVDAATLLAAWGTSASSRPPVPAAPAALRLSATLLGGTLTPGGSMMVRVMSTASAGFNSPVTLGVSGLPAGVTARFIPGILTAPGTFISTIVLTATKGIGKSAGAIAITAIGGGLTATCQVALNVAPVAKTSSRLR